LRSTRFPKELTYFLILAGFFLALFGVSGQNCGEPNTGNCSPIYYLLDFQTLLYSGSVYYVYDYSLNIFGLLFLYLGSILLWRSSNTGHMTNTLKVSIGAIMLTLLIANLPLLPMNPKTQLNCTPASCGINGFVVGPVEYLSIFEILSTFYIVIGFSVASIALGSYFLMRSRKGKSTAVFSFDSEENSENKKSHLITN